MAAALEDNNYLRDKHFKNERDRKLMIHHQVLGCGLGNGRSSWGGEPAGKWVQETEESHSGRRQRAGAGGGGTGRE